MVEALFKKDFSTEPKAADLITLDGDEGKHAVSVRRIRKGEAIALTNGHGLKVHGTVVELQSKSLQIKVDQVERLSEPSLRLRLVQALAKGDRDELAIQAATELGATFITPWQAERSVARWTEEKIAKGRDRWQAICDEAGKQSLRAHFARVEPLVDTDRLALYISNHDFGSALVLDPTSPLGLSAALDTIVEPDAKQTMTVIVGPEGGITEHELQRLQAAGAIRVHLGEDILRTSTAGIAAISVINARAGIYGS